MLKQSVNISAQPKLDTEVGYVSIRAEDFWPCSYDSITQSDLLSLDDNEFHRLQRFFSERAYKRSKSKSHARNIARALKNKRTPYSHPLHPVRYVSWQYRPSVLLESFINDRQKKWLPKNKRFTGRELIIEDCSFFENPEKTMQNLKLVAERECSDFDMSLHFDDEKVKDIAPYMVLALMQRDMIAFMSGGRMKGQIKHVFEAVTLDKFMNINVQKHKDFDIVPFKLKHYQTPEITSKCLALNPTTKETTCDDLVETINKWLGNIKPSKKMLTKSGRSSIKSMIGEILDNAERHSNINGKGSWSAAGFMVRQSDEGKPDKLICHLAFISLGHSISETIVTALPEVTTEMTRYLDSVARKTKLSPNTLRTVYALQDGISRMKNPDIIGGVGLMDIVQFANTIGKYSNSIRPQVTIISGGSCIMFKEPYIKGEKKDGENVRRQFFNPENTSALPPDNNYVFDMGVTFPGTLITTRFALEDEVIENKAL